MDLSLYGLIAFLMGGVILSFALPMLVAPQMIRREVLNAVTKETPGFGHLAFVFLTVIFGLWILSIEYRLSTDMGWNIVIPILGYLSVLKGIIALWWPKWMKELVRDVYKEGTMAAWGILAIAFGIFMWWLAFSVY